MKHKIGSVLLMVGMFIAGVMPLADVVHAEWIFLVGFGMALGSLFLMDASRC